MASGKTAVKGAGSAGDSKKAKPGDKVWVEKSPLTGYVIGVLDEQLEVGETHKFELVKDAVAFIKQS